MTANLHDPTLWLRPSQPTADERVAYAAAARATLEERFNMLDAEDRPEEAFCELTPDDDLGGDLLALVNELLDDHAKLFNYTFPCGFKRPRLNDQEYSLDLRQRLIMAVKAAELEAG